jgi:hypothetical protein
VRPLALRRRVLALAWLPLLAACGSGERARAPAAGDAMGCAVLAGGGIGGAFAEPNITRFWYEINKQVTDRLHQMLLAAHYRAVKLIVPAEETRNNEQWVVQGLAQHHCSRLIQVSHAVNEDAAGKFFRFDVEVMHLQPNATQPAGSRGVLAITVGDWSRQYRYPRTQAAFESFRTGEFAALVFGDLERSGALRPLR